MSKPRARRGDRLTSIATIPEVLREGAPSICTVQAPQSALPHPNFVPVIPSTSRNTHRSGLSPSTSKLCVFPLTLMVKAMASSLFGEWRPTTPSSDAFLERVGQCDHTEGKSIGRWYRRYFGIRRRKEEVPASVSMNDWKRAQMRAHPLISPSSTCRRDAIIRLRRQLRQKPAGLPGADCGRCHP